MLLLASALGLVVVCQSTFMLRRGYQLQQLRAQITEQQAERAVYRAHLGKLRNARRIMRLVAWLGLELQEPKVSVAKSEADADQPAGLQTRRQAPADHGPAQGDDSPADETDESYLAAISDFQP
jgi:hypothetical protein